MRGIDLINVMLPDEIMVEIFRSLESNENREAASLVCKRWLHLARLSRETIHIGFSANADALVERLTDRANLFGNNSVHSVSKCCLSDSGLAAVGYGFTKLESLKLIGGSNITDIGLISIGENCKLLKSLDIQECRIEGEGLAAIGKYCTRLEDLNFRRCKRLNDIGLVHLVFGCGRT